MFNQNMDTVCSDIIAIIAANFSIQDLAAVSIACKHWWNCLKSQRLVHLWHGKYMWWWSSKISNKYNVNRFTDVTEQTFETIKCKIVELRQIVDVSPSLYHFQINILRQQLDEMIREMMIKRDRNN